MTRLVLVLLRPYRGWLAIVFIAMLVEIATSLAAPWPLKLVLDDALGKHHLPHWLEWARQLQKRQDEQFWDGESGGWFNTTGADPSVILRMKEDYDGAEPSPSSISVMNLLMMAHLTNEAELFERIDQTLKMFGPQIGKVARAVPMMIATTWADRRVLQGIDFRPGFVASDAVFASYAQLVEEMPEW